MRLMWIDPDAGMRERLRGHVKGRWPQAVFVDHDWAAHGALPAEILAQGFDAVLLGRPAEAGGGLDRLVELAQRPGFAPLVFLGGHAGDALCRSALQLGACAAVGTDEPQRLEPALQQAIAQAAEQQAQARALRFNSGSEAQSRRFSGAHIPGYRRVRTIAAGHFAELHLAESDARAQLVVIKVARDMVQNNELDPAFRRLLQEHDLAQRVDPRYVVRVHDLGISDEHAYLVMEYFDGGDLRRRMREPLPMTALQALRVASCIAHGLAAVHAIGLLHRDLKPGNVMLRADGGVALIDFGLAKDAALAADITDAGQIIGTPHYMSPEQGHGEPIDVRSDLYSLGVILFEMLTGSKPFIAENPMAIIYLHRKSPIPQLPPALCDLQPLLQQLLAKEPRGRFDSARQAAQALEQAAAELAARELAA